MRRLVFLPIIVFATVAAAAMDCGGTTFEVVDGSADGSDLDAGGGSGGSSGGIGSGGGNSSGTGSGGTGSSSGGASSSGMGSSGASGSAGSSGSGSSGSGAGGSSGTGSGGSGSGASSGGSSGAGSGSGGSGSSGGLDGGTCPANHCAIGETCCGGACCPSAQLCCLHSGPVLPPDPYYCFTPSATQPVCPRSCAPKCVSDRNVKRDIEVVDEQAVLEGVSRMPISTWSYRTDDPSIRHLGPMAQDFHAAFGLGDSDRQYDAIDAHGVALAAIKALKERLEEQGARIERLERENHELQESAACGRR